MQAVYTTVSAAGQRASVVGFTGNDAARFEGGNGFMGTAYLRFQERLELTRLICLLPEPYQSPVTSVIIRAGIAIPNRIRELVCHSMAGTPFAWRTAVVAHFSKIPPICLGLPQAKINMGWCWPDLFASSLSAIEAAELVVPLPEQLTLVGEWSAPMSKAEFARRVRQNADARFRDVRALFNKLEKQQEEGSTKWSFRLDTLDESLRKNLESDRP